MKVTVEVVEVGCRVLLGVATAAAAAAAVDAVDGVDGGDAVDEDDAVDDAAAVVVVDMAAKGVVAESCEVASREAESDEAVGWDVKGVE